MLSSKLGLIEMLLVFGLVLAAAVWELVSLRRAARKARTGQPDLGKASGESDPDAARAERG